MTRSHVLKTISPPVILLLCGFSCRSEGTAPAREATSESALLDKQRVAPSRSPGVTRNPSDVVLEDADIQEAVARALRKDPIVPSDEVQVQVADGVVDLTGQVPHILALERAALLAESVKGVRSVTARVSLAPSDREDSAIQRDIEEELMADPAVEESNIQVQVMDGVVTLQGIADSWLEKETAGRRSKSIKGVRVVANLLTIENEVMRSDDDIRADVRERLFWDALVDDRLLVITSEDRQVSIAGVVGSAAERRRAREDAWVPGAESVNVQNVDVEWLLKEKYRRVEKHPAVSDEEVADAIERAFSLDPRISLFAIKPAAAAGIVTLAGKVNSLSTKNAAEHIARHTRGVMGVRNYIEVSRLGRADPALQKAIAAGLRRNAITESLEIETRVEDGRATLTGTVDSVAEKAEAHAIAGRTPGVVSVNNQLSVRRPDGFYVDPYLYPYQPYADSWTEYAGMRPGKSDVEILRDIESEMFWNPFIDSAEIEVGVSDGKVTLSGHVDSWRERESAEKSAFEGGATTVENQLKIVLN